MNKAIFTFICATLLLLCTNPLSAQSVTPDWVKQIYGSNGGVGWGVKPATDRHGNVYALSYEKGTVNAEGQLTPDSNSITVLTSWDCDGNLRWMKSFGAADPYGYNGASFVETDTSEGVYISGMAAAYQVPSNVYWGADTTITLSDRLIEYLIKYNSQGQFQWFRILMDSSDVMFPRFSNLSVSPSGDVWAFALLNTGVYAGGTFTINARKYYAINYDASGTFQSAIPFDMTPPAPPDLSLGETFWEFDPTTSRFYGSLSYHASYGGLTIGNTTIAQPTGNSLGSAVLAAFDKQGQNLWVRQGSSSKTSYIENVAFGNDGTVYLYGMSEEGNVFCGDTTPAAPNFFYDPVFIFALDTNANRLWSNYSANSEDVNIWGISCGNNTIAAVGPYNGTLAWDNDTITALLVNGVGYMLRVDAATGSVLQLSNISSNGVLNFGNSAIDKNGNLYISGSFQGSLAFGNDNLSSYPNSFNSNSFLLKYRNVVCNCDLLQPAFNFSNSAATTFQFTYTGQTPYASISWDFGDGTTVTGMTSPTHTYAAAGTYPVCVTVTNGCGSNTSCKYVSFTTGIKDAGGAFSSVNIYPNPVQDELIITNLPQGSTVEVLDMTGRLLKRVESGNAELHINVEGLSAGIYLLRFTDKEGRRGSSMFVKR
jgi:hypothetical protein